MPFLQPICFLLLLVLPLLVLTYLWKKAKKKKLQQRFVAPRLASKLTKLRRDKRNQIGFFLQILGLVFVIIALARPYAGTEEVKIENNGYNVFFLIDTSRSMLSQDVQPSRIDLAHTQAIKIMQFFPKVHFGLATFAANLTFVAPYSIDHETLIKEMRNQQPNSQGASGSNLPRAILSLLSIFEETKTKPHALIIFSDGEDHQSEMKQAIKMAKNMNVPIFTIGVGTQKGGTIPDAATKDNKFRDKYNNIVYTKLKDTHLKELAETTSGYYSNATNLSTNEIKHALGRMKKQLNATQTIVQANEIYTPFLLTGFIMIFTGFLLKSSLRRPLFFFLGSLFFLHPQQAQAEQQDKNAKLMQRVFNQGLETHRGRNALKRHEYGKAIKHLKKALNTAKGNESSALHLALGEAYFRKKEYEQAQFHYSQSMLHETSEIQANASYNYALSLFHPSWEKLQPEKGADFKQHLENALTQKEKNQKKEKNQTPPISINTLKDAVTEWTDAVEFMHYAEKSAPKTSDYKKKAKQNAAFIQEKINIVKNIIADQQSLENQQQNQDPNQQQKKQQQGEGNSPPKPNKDEEQKNQQQQNKSESQKNEKNEKNQTKKENPDQQQKEKENPNKEQEDSDNPKQSETGKQSEEQTKEQANPKNQRQQEHQKQRQQEQKSREEKARTKLEQLADEQRKPSQMQQSRRNYRTEKDW